MKNDPFLCSKCPRAIFQLKGRLEHLEKKFEKISLDFSRKKSFFLKFWERVGAWRKKKVAPKLPGFSHFDDSRSNFTTLRSKRSGQAQKTPLFWPFFTKNRKFRLQTSQRFPGTFGALNFFKIFILRDVWST